MGGRGVFVGRDGSGAAFCYDPWVLYGDGTLDDPNAIVLGKLGQGKSALVKTFLWRMLVFGRRAFVLDVKREYGPLCEAVGVKPVSLVPGGRRAAQPTRRASRGARADRTAAGRRDHRDRWAGDTDRGSRAARSPADGPRPAAPGAGRASQRSPRSRRAVRPEARWPAAKPAIQRLATDARRGRS